MKRLFIPVLLIVLAGALLAPGTLRAQLGFRRFTFEDGLPSLTVYCAFQDRDGFIWIGTDNGIARYDGFNFRKYGIKDGLIDLEVFGFFQDSKGRIWMRTITGKTCYILNSKIVNEQEDPLLKQIRLDGYINSIIEFEGKVYFSSRVSRRAVYTDTFAYSQNDEADIDFFTHKGRLYQHVAGYILDDLTCDTLVANFADEFHDPRATEDSLYFYFSSLDSLFRYEKGTHKHPELLVKLDGCGEIIHLSMNRTGSILVGATQRALLVNPSNGKSTVLAGGEIFTHVIEDIDGGIWMSSYYKGLRYAPAPDSRMILASRPESPWNFLIEQDTARGQWLIIGYGGRTIFINDTILDTVQNPYHKSLIGHAYGTCWIGRDTLIIYGQSYFSLLHVPSRKFVSGVTTTPKSVFRLPSGKILMSVGRSAIQTSLDSILFHYGSINANDYARMTGMALFRGLVHYSSDQGFGTWNTDTKKVSPVQFSSEEERELARSRMTCMTSQGDDYLWVAIPEKGIFRYDGTSLKMLSASFKLGNVRRMHTGPDGSIWACNPEGVYRFKPTPGGFERMSYHPGERYFLSGVFDMLPMGETVWVTYAEGVMELSPSTHRHKIRLYVEEFRLPGDTLRGYVTDLFVKPGQDQLSLLVHPISLMVNEDIQSAYRFPESDTNWNFTQASELLFRSLQAGDYPLEIKAMSQTGISSPVYRVMLHVAPRFYQTWWFITISVLTFFACAALLIRRRFRWLNQKHEQEKIRAQEEKEKAEFNLHVQELEQKALRLQMNPHFIFNAINTIPGIYATKDIPAAKDYTANLSRLIRLILENSRDPLVSVEKEAELLKLYMKIMQQRFGEVFTWKLEIDPEVDVLNTLIPPMIIQPFLENAIQHGVLPLGMNGKVLVQMRLEGGFISVVIRDNGVGLTESRNNRNSTDHKSMGIDITRQRVHLNNPEDTGAINIRELKDEKGTVCGTEVTINLIYKHKEAL